MIPLGRAGRPLRFLISGGANTALCFAVYALLVRVGVPFAVANLAAAAFGVACNFALQRRFVFRSRDPGRFGRFALTWALIWAVQTGMIALLVRRGIGATLAGLIVLPGAALASYLAGAGIVFRPAQSGAR